MNNKLKILYVEDDKIFAKSIKGAFETEDNVSLDLASSTNEGLEKIAKGNYHVLITDGILGTRGHGFNDEYYVKVGGYELAKSGKENGLYVVGFSSDPDLLYQVASDYLDINIKKPPQDLFKFMELVINGPNLSEEK